MKTPKGILFDLDNTLVDRSASIRCYAECFFREFGNDLYALNLHEVADRLVEADQGGHREKSDFLSRVLAWPEWKVKPDIQSFNRHWMWEFPPRAVGADELVMTLDFLIRREIRLGIITNGSARAQNGKIMALHLWRYFPLIVVSELAGVRKPERAIFATALEQLELAPEEVWFVGDHPEADVLGADAAGLVGVWLTGFHRWPEEKPEPSVSIQRLPDIIELLDENEEASSRGTQGETGFGIS